MDLRQKIAGLLELDKCARETGFDVCHPILAREICLDDRVRMHCQLNLCGNYQNNLMCPPFLPPLAETRQLIGNFTFGLLLQLNRSLEDTGKEAMRILFDTTAVQLNHMIVDLERKAFAGGFRLAMALGAGECKLCDTCVINKANNKCIHPGAARPSMEGMGIDVLKTFNSAGLAMDFKADQLTVAGLLLVD